MKLISVNTSKQKSIEYQGKEISTGIFKEPIEGGVYVKRENLEGDEQADLLNHGGLHKAVYAFSSEHYNYWRETLKNPHLKHGAFGENLTISGLDEASVFIGDQFSVGQCVLEVSQPRVPCFKLGIVLNNTKASKLFIKSFNTGVYFRVIKEGIITAGDQVIKINEVPNSVSVRSLFRAYFDKSYDQTKQIMAGALLLETLAPEWQDKLTGRVG
jgi:MOSC domain-containing protein YiiM